MKCYYIWQLITVLAHLGPWLLQWMSSVLKTNGYFKYRGYQIYLVKITFRWLETHEAFGCEMLVHLPSNALTCSGGVPLNISKRLCRNNKLSILQDAARPGRCTGTLGKPLELLTATASTYHSYVYIIYTGKDCSRKGFHFYFGLHVSEVVSLTCFFISSEVVYLTLDILQI